MSEVAQTLSEEMSGAPPTLDAALIEGLAEHVHVARDGDGPEGLARGQGIDVEVDHGLPPGIDGIAVDRLSLVIVRPSRDRALLMLRILHELAHLVLQRLGVRHSHGDVWALAVAMGAPQSVCRGPARRSALALALATGLPAYATALRLVMLECLEECA